LMSNFRIQECEKRAQAWQWVNGRDSRVAQPPHAKRITPKGVGGGCVRAGRAAT
jgi:hypothetical protein